METEALTPSSASRATVRVRAARAEEEERLAVVRVVGVVMAAEWWVGAAARIVARGAATRGAAREYAL